MSANTPLTRERIEEWRIAWANDGLKPEVFAELNAMCDLAAGGAWVPVNERLPKAPHGMLLVTNNIDARDAHGFMSHLWLVRMIHYRDEFGYYAFDDYDNTRPVHITHWRDALTAQTKGSDRLPPSRKGEG